MSKGLIRRKSLPKLIKTSALVKRWQVSDETVRRLCKKHNVRGVKPGGAENSPILWHQADVERAELKMFGEVL